MRNPVATVEPAAAGLGWGSGVRRLASSRGAARARYGLPLYFAFLGALAPGIGQAQIVTDGTVGPARTLPGPDRQIPQELGTTRGGNLFHSFRRFDVPAGESTTFQGSAALSAIVSRVTGGTASRIDGRLAVSAPNADFYFLNPAGVLFGPEASVDVPGAFHVATADHLRFSDGTRFQATTDTPSLTVAEPAAFGFLGDGNGLALDRRRIALEGSSLAFAQAATVTLAAGRIEIQAGADPAIKAPDSTLRLVAVDGPGDVPVQGNATTVARFGPIVLGGPSDGSAVPDAEDYMDGDDDSDGDDDLGEEDGDDAPDPAIDLGGDVGGTAVIRAGALTISDFSIAADTEGDTTSPRTAIDITAQRQMRIDGESQIAAIASGAGRSGDLAIRGGRIELAGDAELLSDVAGTGIGGVVELRADTLSLSGDAEIASDVEEGATGSGGRVQILAGRIALAGDSEISSDTAGPGDGGAVTITARGTLEVRQAAAIVTDASSTGDAGAIRLSAQRIRLDGGTIAADSSGPGRAGAIGIVAGDTLALHDGRILTTSAQASGGAITIRVGRLVDLRNARIATSVASGLGDGGDIGIDTTFLVLNPSLIAANAVGGTGGDVTIVADTLFLAPGSAITATSVASVDGTISIRAPEADVAGDLTPLEVALLDAASRLQPACAARVPGTRNTFAVTGPDSLPAGPLDGLSPGFHDPDEADTAGAGAPQGGASAAAFVTLACAP